MLNNRFIKAGNAGEVSTGSILVAQPFWENELYKHAVIILLDHDKTGSSGIILNKRSTLSVVEALPDLRITTPLFYGGSFNTHTISFIHNDNSIPESSYIGNNLYYGGDFDMVQEMIMNEVFDLEKIRFYAGFTEWNAGQLDEEIYDNKWWVSGMHGDDFFGTSRENLWSHELLNNGHLYGLFEKVPDPCLN